MSFPVKNDMLDQVYLIRIYIVPWVSKRRWVMSTHTRWLLTDESESQAGNVVHVACCPLFNSSVHIAHAALSLFFFYTGTSPQAA